MVPRFRLMPLTAGQLHESRFAPDAAPARVKAFMPGPDEDRPHPGPHLRVYADGPVLLADPAPTEQIAG